MSFITTNDPLSLFAGGPAEEIARKDSALVSFPFPSSFIPTLRTDGPFAIEHDALHLCIRTSIPLENVYYYYYYVFYIWYTLFNMAHE